MKHDQNNTLNFPHGLAATETKNTSSFGAFISFMPVSLFGGVMGLCGLSFCWHQIRKENYVFDIISHFFGVLAITCFLVLTIAYSLKWKRYPVLVKEEFENPVSVSFFGTFIISLLLLPGVLMEWFPLLAITVWCVGALSMFLFAWYVLHQWINQTKDPVQAQPAWIIPVVGTLDVPIVGLQLPIHGNTVICLFFFSIGFFFALVLLTLLISRLLFVPLAPAQQASLLILVGPFALAFSGYEMLNRPDMFSTGIFYADIFLFLLLGNKLLLLQKTCPFRFGWWAISFPLTAVTLAAFRYNRNHKGFLPLSFSLVLLLLSTAVILYLLYQTIWRIVTDQLEETVSAATANK